MPLSLTTLNGLYYDFTSIRLAVAGISIAEQLQDISFSDKMTPAKMRGTHPIKLGTGLGQYEADASISLLKDYWQAFQREIKAKLPGGQGLTQLVFPISVSYAPVGSANISTVELKECRIIGREYTHPKSGGDGLMVKIPLDVRYILEDGVCLAPLDLQ
jgi:hypothetical protein